MARIEKTVFISYRRADEPWALAVFENLTQHGYDVFIDFDRIASGNFATVILENIRARAHFLVLLTPTALERCRFMRNNRFFSCGRSARMMTVSMYGLLGVEDSPP